VALLVVGGSRILSGPQGPGSAPPPGALGPAPNVDLASMSPGEAADRLFNRVAMALQVRDSIEVLNFLPMALDAHELALPLSDVRLFRYSFLQRVATDYQTALRLAQEGLDREPDHLLLLSAAAEAARELGDLATARAYFQHMLDVWATETASGRTDYVEHERLLPILLGEAETFVADG
jgi:tetratricopeptide (TPR) repeat protein